MNYIAYTFSAPADDALRDMFVELLGRAGFDGFMDTDDGLSAYCRESDLSETSVNEILAMEQFRDVRVLKTEVIPDQDWNAEWEASYVPAVINDRCRIRAPFHEPDDRFEYDIVIEPKMSFGTAHHETTSQMIQLMFETDFKGKSVLDMGCGTAVLAILARRLGAKRVAAIDNDEWAYRNSIDNVERNNITDIDVELGDASSLKDRRFDIILANINRNILLNDMHEYVGALNDNGKILFSGFYENDLTMIRKKAEDLGLKYIRHIEKNEWVAAEFEI